MDRTESESVQPQADEPADARRQEVGTVKTAPHIVEIPIDEVIVEGRHRTECLDIQALADNIAEVGLIHAIPVRPGYQLVAGRRRLEACRLLGWKTIAVVILYHLEDARLHLLAECSENTFRKPFRPSETVNIARALRPLADEEARKRQTHRGLRASGIFSEAGQAMDQVAALVGRSRPTLTKATRIVDAAEEDPEIYGDLLREMDETGNIGGVYIRLRELQGLEPGKRRPGKAKGVSVRKDKNGDLLIRVYSEWPDLLERVEAFIETLEADI